MKTQKDPLFPAKIMLFGEYSIIHNSMGLNIPYNQFEGKLTIVRKNLHNEDHTISNDQLRQFAVYIKDLIDKDELQFEFDIKAFQKDVSQGLVFDSNIPQGFGIGSSGALCAALYDRYAKDKISNDIESIKVESERLKNIFAQLESYFHGHSSGIDPLICYIDHPFLINDQYAINPVKMPDRSDQEKGAIFLIDTGKSRKTLPFVQLFLEKCKHDPFMRMIKDSLIPISNNCITAFLNGDKDQFYHNLKELSKLFLSHLTPMIPHQFRKIWEKGIETQAYYLKLCGAGGGGFLLGFTTELEKAQKELKGYDLNVIHRF